MQDQLRESNSLLQNQKEQCDKTLNDLTQTRACCNVQRAEIETLQTKRVNLKNELEKVHELLARNKIQTDEKTQKLQFNCDTLYHELEDAKNKLVALKNNGVDSDLVQKNQEIDSLRQDLSLNRVKIKDMTKEALVLRQQYDELQALHSRVTSPTIKI